MKKLLFTLCLILLQLVIAMAQQPTDNAKKLNKVAFTNVNIIDVEKERILASKTVYIENGYIKTISDAKDIKLAEDVFLIDGKNKYLIPGLADMHTHFTGTGAFSTGLEPPLYQEKDLMLFLVNGVTTVRNMCGTEVDLTIKQKISNDELLSPHYYSSGHPIVTGKSGLIVKTPQEAVDVVLAQKKAGFDFIKVYCCFKKDNKEVYDKIIEISQANKIPAVGHIQFLLPIEDALKLKSIEHFEHIPRYFNNEFPDLEKHKAIVEKFLESKTVICPTLSGYDLSTVKLSSAEFLAKPESHYLTKDNYEEIKKGTYVYGSEDNLNLVKDIYELEIQYASFLHKQKIPFILGADSGGIQYVIPGFSIHRELELLNQVGLSPIEALQTGTINVARFLGNSDTRGSIAENKESDLVLLDENPLVSISNTRKISGVMIGKYWIDKNNINRILELLKKR